MEEYPDFEETCGYGSVTGILGANCRHNFTPFIPGVMERTYTDEQLANIDPPPFEYEGKTYTHYEATQKQREIERTVRKWKRREAAAANPEDKQACQIRIKRLEQKYKEFSNAADLRTQPERMKAYIPRQKVVDNPATSSIINSKVDYTVKNKSEPTFADKIKAIREDVANGGDFEANVRKAGKAVAGEYRNHVADIQAKVQPINESIAQVRDRLRATQIGSKDRKELERQYFDLVNQRRKVQGSEPEWLKSKLGEIREMGIGNNDIKAHCSNGKSPRIKEVTQAYNVYPTDWVNKSVGFGKMQVGSANRGYYIHFAYRKKGEIYISGSGEEGFKTAIHEVAHRFEHTIDFIIPSEKAFFEKRTAGLQPEWLGTGYKKSEKAIRDDFLDHYMGKQNTDGSYELVSMGFQLAYTNPAYLAKDPEMQEWIYGLLAIG